MIRIRVRPNYGGFGAMGGLGGLGGFGRVGMAAPLAMQRLQAERSMNSMRLNMERALWGERLQRARLEAALQYGGGAMMPAIGAGYLAPGMGMAPGFGMPPGFGTLPIGGFPQGGFPMMGGMPFMNNPFMSGGYGQTNVNNMSGIARGHLNQAVSNRNDYHNNNNTYVVGGMGGGFPGWMGGLLNGLF